MPPSTTRALRAIAAATLVCGVLDIGYVFVVFGWREGRAERVLQGIAAALLGPEARSGGWTTAGMGLAMHFGVALGATVVFYILSRRLRALVRHPWIGGAIYGAAFYVLMNAVILRLTRLPPSPFPPPGWRLILLAHVLCVGWPIAWMIHALDPPSLR
jgi:hypothetical protein